MALKPLNSVGGFSVGEIPANVILANADITANKGTFTGNLLISNSNANYGILTDNLYYSNGQPWDLQEAAGSNTQIQFNDNNNFGASANFTFNSATNVLTVTGNINATNANIGSGNINLYANGEINTNGLITTSANVNGNNFNISNLLSGNVANFNGNVTAQNFIGNVQGNISGNIVVPGNNTSVIFNDNGNAGASDAFTFNKSSNVVTVNGNLSVQNASLGNLATANYVNVANDLNGNIANFSGNFTALNANLGNLATANFVNVASNVNVTNTMEAGNVRTDNLLHANGLPWDFQQPAGSNTQLQFNDNNDFGASANLTFDFATQTLAVTGLVNVTGNANVSDTINGNVANFSGNLTAANGNLGNLVQANYVNVASNVTSSNLTVNLELAGNTANFTGNISASNANLGNLATANYVNVSQQINGNVANFSGNLTSLNANLGNLATANYVNVANDLNGNIANFTGNLTSLNANLGNLATANYVNVANDLNVIGNVNAGNLVGTLANGNSNVRIFQDANVEISSNSVSNIVTISDTGLFTSGNIHSTAGYIIANGNVTANGFLVGANAVVTGEANLGSVLTANITSAGNLTISAGGTNENIILVPTGTGAVDVSGKKIIDLADPTNPTDAATKEYVDAMAGEGLDIHTPVRLETPTALNATYAQGGTTQTTTDISGGKTITFSANHGLSVNDGIVWTNSFNGIVGGEAYWVFSVPALNQITIRDGYFGPEVTTLTNGTGLSQASRANPGVGATLTNAGANAALQIDGVATANNDRILVYTQSNAYENGVYIVSDTGNATAAWVLTRATDFDKYNPDSPNGLSAGSYVFVTSGLTGAGESYVMTLPTGEVIIGTDNITFTQFSAAGSYTAGNGINITGTTISANVDNDTTAIVGGNIVVKSGANLTTPNIGDATFSSLSWNTLSNGNVSANNLSIGNIANITLDLTVGGNIQANGTISANANVSGLNLTTSGNVHATGNVLANNVTANTLLSVPTANVSNIVNAGNIDITNALTGNTANFTSNVLVSNLTVNLALAGNTANFSSNVVVNNLTTNLEFAGNTANFSSNVVVNNLTTNLEFAGNTANFSGNVVIANLASNGLANVGQLNVTGNVTSDLLPNANLTHDLGNSTLRWDNVYAGNLDASGNLTIAGDLSANNFTANILTANNTINLGNTSVEWGTVTTTSITANQTIAQASYSGVTGVEFLVKGEDSTGSKYSVATVVAVTDGANVDYSTFATVNLGGTTGSLSVGITGSNIELRVTPSSSNSTVWTTQYRLV